MADKIDVESKRNENILYDLSVLVEWKLENELFTRNNKEKLNTTLRGRASSLARRSLWTFMRTIGVSMQMPTPCLLPEQLVKLKSSQSPWHIAVSSSGSWLAVAQESCIEIRSLQDGLESIYGRCTFSYDPYPQWRCVVWSEDESMVACSRSNGAVDVYDIVGSLLFTIPGVPDDGTTPLDLSDTVSALIFTDFEPKEEQWSYELLVISHHGTMSSYLVGKDGTFQLRYTFIFSTQYPRGVSSVCYSPRYKMLLVGGSGLGESALISSKARQEGITAWRLLSDVPYCKLITDYEDDKLKAKVKVSVLSKLKVSSVVQWNSVQVDGIFFLCLSPNGTTMVSLHFSGKLSMWDIPSLRLKKSFVLEKQPDWSEFSPHLLENPAKLKRVKDLIPHKQLLDANFWSEDLLILARCTGAVSVVSHDDLQNLLGKSPEWYEPSPRVAQAYNGGFLGLECELRFPKKRIQMIKPDSGDDEEDDSDEEDASFMSKATWVSKQVLYYLTDSERFQPPKKKPRYVTKLYRVVLLKSTTPEELYTRKIEAEEYGEALVLAQAYNLDCDLVYQRQWRKCEVSFAAIQDYLNKISKRSWILHECLERVPENIDAMRELLQYGLNGTDLSALIAIGKEEDGGRFILCDPDEGLYEDIYDDFNPESLRKKEEKRAQIRQSLLDQVDLSNLNLEQKELCRARLKFLQYLDRLRTYECILGGESAAAERYNAVFFTSFRSRSIFELAAEYAQNSDWKALETLMTFHSTDLAAHRLAILSNFPETTDPSEYKSLLPEISEDGEVIPWETDSWRDSDWSEAPKCRRAVDLGSEDEASFLYTSVDSKYRREKLGRELVQEWYFTRVCEIESKASLVDSAIELVKLAMERGAENLSELLDDLTVMDMIVYECGVDDSLTFSKLREMANYDRLEYIMSKSSDEMYTKNLRRWMMPFLQQCEQKEPMAYNQLLRDFVLTKARGDLTLVLKIFEASKPNASSPVIQSQTELMSLVLDSLYICERNDQLDLAIKVFECLPLWSRDPTKESQEAVRLNKQVDQLEQHISAAKILQAHGISKTLASIKDSESNPDEAKSLMVKLTRLAGRRSIPLRDIEWHKLHEDVLSLQRKVYHCISQSVCHEIFVESLMCSGRQETIHLAGQMLERNSVESKPNRAAKGTGMDKVPYSKAVELVLSAAKEYFDSSANLSDPCMDLARSCLNLILDAPLPIQEELDLIASLALLDEFGVAVLPLQVRLSKNKLELVQKAVTTKPTSYKQTQRLLRLGQLLGLPSGNNSECEGNILQMSAEAAVTALDYEFAYQCCERMISLSHSPAWSVCVRLAEQEGFRSIDAKAKVLSFALTYCSKDMIQPVLQARCLLETQILYEQINKILNEDKESSLPASRESPFSARAAIKQTQQILSSTKRTTSAVLSTMTDAKWWQSAVSYLKHPQHHRGGGNATAGKEDSNAGFERQGCHPFYAGIIDDCFEDVSAADYWDVSGSPSCADIIVSANLLRTAKLEDMLTQGDQQQPAVEALMDLAKQTMTRDTTLGLAYLLALPKDANVDSCFEAFPSTDISLQVAVYFYSLQIYSLMQPYTPPHAYALYRQTPSKIIGRVLDYIASSTELEWPEEAKILVKKLQTYQEMLEDFSQASTLQRLGKGVNVIRFAEDCEYKRETIFGLVMCLDDEVYNIALSLAKRYGLALWEVYMCHLEYLFSDSGISTEELQTRVNKLGILPALNERSSEFTERMMTRIYPTLAGTDSRSLTYFFSLLETVQEKVLCGLTPSDHAALLKKLKPICSGLDYKKLMDKTTSPMEVLRPCLNASNINTLAKLTAQIPDKEGAVLQPSSLYGCWACQVFLGKDGAKKPPPENMAAWVHRYEAIGEWIQKLLPEDLLDLIDSIVFTPTAREKLDIPCRTEITRRALKFSRQSGKKKKQTDTGKLNWEECSQHLQTRLSHLTTLSCDTLQSFAQATDPTFSSYAEKYDLSKGDLKVVELLLVQMILDGQAVELVDDILQGAPPTSLNVRKVVQHAVSLIVKALRGEDFVQGITACKSWLEVLQMVVENVRIHQDNGGDLVQAEDVMSLLRSFCSDASIEVPPRLDVLKVLEKSFDLSDTDRTLLTLYRTDALVSSTWPDLKVSEENIINEESRFDLFLTVLDKCSNKDQFVTLCRILILWPPFSSTCSSNPDKNPWVTVFTAILTSLEHGGEVVNMVIKDKCSEFPLDVKCTEHVFEMMLQHNQIVPAVKTILQSSHATLLDKGLGILSNLTEGTDDEGLLTLILSNRLSPQVVSMPVFANLIEYILKCQDQTTCPEYASPVDIASQLYKANAVAEAGSLLLQTRSSHPVLQTFSSALTSVSHWLKKS